MLRFDGIAALGVWPVDVLVGDMVFRLDPQPASFWILHLLEDDLFGLLNLLIDSQEFDRALLEGTITSGDCIKAAKEAIALSSGMLWWSALRLVASARQSLQVNGELVLSGIDPTKISLGAYCAAVYAILVRNADDKQIKKVNSQIEATPEGVSAMERYDPDVAADQFDAFMASRSR